MEATEDKARRLGLPLPVFSREASPGVYQCWEDRVLQVDSLASRGRDTQEAERDALAYTGRPMEPRPVPMPARPARTRDHASTAGVADPLVAIEEALDDEEPGPSPGP